MLKKQEKNLLEKGGSSQQSTQICVMNKKILKEVNEVACEIIRGECNINRTNKVYKKLIKEIDRVEKKKKKNKHTLELLEAAKNLAENLKVYIDVNYNLK